MLLAPVFVAAGVVASSYGDSAGHWSAMVRPLLLVTGAAAALELLTWAVFRQAEAASLASGMLVLALLGHPFSQLAALMVGPWLVVSTYARVRLGRRLLDLRSAVTTLSTAYLAVSLVALVVGGAVDARDFAAPTSVAGIVHSDHRPNLYVLLLDGYARSDQLASVFSLDNSPFLAELTEMGFDVYADSHTDYDATSWTVASMLSAELDDLAPLPSRSDPAGRTALYREVRRRLAEAPALGELRRAGYSLTVIQPPVVHVIERGWDQAVDPGEVTDFEASLIAHSPIGWLLRDWVLQQQRERAVRSLEAWAPRPPDARSVLMAHVMLPHPPFVLGPDLGPPPEMPCWPTRCALFASQAAALGISEQEFARRVRDQVLSTNQLVLPFVRQVVASDPGAVIVVMSDHGSRYSVADVTERHANLFVARTPGRPWLFGVAPTPRDLFETLLRAYDPARGLTLDYP